MGTGYFPGVKCGRGVLLTTHPLLVPQSYYTSTNPLGHTRPVTWNFTFYIYNYFGNIKIISENCNSSMFQIFQFIFGDISHPLKPYSWRNSFNRQSKPVDSIEYLQRAVSNNSFQDFYIAMTGQLMPMFPSRHIFLLCKLTVWGTVAPTITAYFNIINHAFVSLNTLKTKRRLLYLKTQSVPRCKHFSSRL